MHYLQYHRASGSIVAQVEMNPRFAIDADEYAYLSGTGTQDQHWIDSDAICPRVPCEVQCGPSLVEASASAVVIATGLPDPCWARIRGTSSQPFAEQFLQVEGGSLMFMPEITGTYVVTLEGQYTSPPITFEVVSLDAFKATRHDLVSAQKAAVMALGTSLHGYRWDADAAAQLSVNGMATSINAGIPLPSAFYWTSFDNQDVPFTAQDILDLSAALAAFNFAVHDHSRTLKSQIADAATIDAVMAIDVTAGWPS